MSWRATSWASEQRTGNTITKAVLWKLADNANDDGVCWPSVPLIARHCECSVRTIQEHVQRLEAIGLIWIERRSAGGVNLPNVYHLRMPGAVDRDGGVVQELHQGGGAGAAPVVRENPGVVRQGAPGGAATRTTRTAIEPSRNRQSLTPAAAGESDGALALGKGEPERFPAFRDTWAQAMPGGFPEKDSAAALAEFTKQSRTVPSADLIAAARLHGVAETERARRYTKGDFRTKLPSNWLKDRGWFGFLERVRADLAAETDTAAVLARVRGALGAEVYGRLVLCGVTDAELARFEGLIFHAPATFVAAKPFQAARLREHRPRLEREFGEGFQVQERRAG